MRPLVVRVPVVLAFLTLLSTTGCASVYMNDPDMAKQADAADTLVQGADTLKPYADQLANLQAFSAQQDLAVANRDVANRDAVLTPLVAADPAARLAGLDTDACARLKTLAGGDPCGDPARITQLVRGADRLGTAVRLLAQNEETAAATRAAFERNRPAGDTTKDDCVSLLTPGFAPPAGLPVYAAASLDALTHDCQRAQAQRDRIAGLGLLADGSVLQGFSAPALAPARGLDPAVAEQLKARIKAAAEEAKSGHVQSLAAFQADVEAILQGSSAVAQIAGLNDAQSTLADVLKGTLCAPPPTNGTDCAAIAAASTSGRAAAAWTVLQAIAQLMDANDPRLRSANWLAAANAILAMDKTNAQIQLDADTAMRSSSLARYQALARALQGLALTHQVAAKAYACPGADDTSCAMAAYLDAWNAGLIPADVLAYREPLIFSQAALKKAQAAQTQQQALARAASASLKAYADGGVQPATVSQLLVDAGLLGIVAAK